MKQLTIFLIIGLLLIASPGIASAAINVTAETTASSFIRWTWDPATLTGINVDGKLISSFDPAATSYILSNLGPDEMHQITIYTAGDSGTNTTYTAPEDTGDVPLGLWIYGIPAVIFLLVARYARVAVINVLCIIFALFGMYQLITVKAVMDGNLWTMCLIVYFILMFVGFINWAYMTGRVWK